MSEQANKAPLFTLVYSSTVSGEEPSKQVLLDILAASRRNNPKNGITGMLLYKDGTFLQVLEGERDKVESLYKHIERDGRHRSLLTLLSENIAERSFGEWSMAFRDVSAPELANKEGFADFLNVPFSSSYFSRNPTTAQQLLLQFRRFI